VAYARKLAREFKGKLDWTDIPDDFAGKLQDFTREVPATH
jgi:hypothetical protein